MDKLDTLIFLLINKGIADSEVRLNTRMSPERTKYTNYLSACLSAGQSTNLCVCQPLSVSLFFSLSVCLCLCLSLSLSLSPSLSLSLSVCLSLPSPLSRQSLIYSLPTTTTKNVLNSFILTYKKRTELVYPPKASDYNELTVNSAVLCVSCLLCHTNY